MSGHWQKMKHGLRTNLSYDNLTCEPDMDILSMLHVLMTVDNVADSSGYGFPEFAEWEFGKADDISETTM